MILSKGDIYRLGLAIKNVGERMAHIKILGIPVLVWACGPVISMGVAIKDSVLQCPIGEIGDDDG